MGRKNKSVKLINVHFICRQQADRIVPSVTKKVLHPKSFGDIDSAGVSIASDQDNSNDDSITISEDSDATRIYNLNTRETKIVPTSKPIKTQQSQLSSRKMMESDDNNNQQHQNGLEFIEEAYEERQVIEPDVIDNLPSVKKLAQLYLLHDSNDKPKSVQLNKPKVSYFSYFLSRDDDK